MFLNNDITTPGTECNGRIIFDLVISFAVDL